MNNPSITYFIASQPQSEKSGTSSKLYPGTPFQAWYARKVWYDPGMNMSEPSTIMDDQRSAYCRQTLAKEVSMSKVQVPEFR